MTLTPKHQLDKEEIREIEASIRVLNIFSKYQEFNDNPIIPLITYLKSTWDPNRIIWSIKGGLKRLKREDDTKLTLHETINALESKLTWSKHDYREERGNNPFNESNKLIIDTIREANQLIHSEEQDPDRLSTMNHNFSVINVELEPTVQHVLDRMREKCLVALEKIQWDDLEIELTDNTLPNWANQ